MKKARKTKSRLGKKKLTAKTMKKVRGGGGDNWSGREEIVPTPKGLASTN